jgi:hypothetical protein
VPNKTPLVVGANASDFIGALNTNYANINNWITNSPPVTGLMTLANTGTKTPATSSNSYLAKYKNFKLGGIIQYSMYSYIDVTGNWALRLPCSPDLFYKGAHDIDKWVSDAKDAGIEYLVFSIFDGTGFALFDNPIPFPDYILNTVFGYKKYDVASAGADVEITNKFYTACAKYGIEPVPYVCPVWQNNMSRTATGLKNPNGAFSGTVYTATEKQYSDNFVCKVLQYILTTWPSNYVWVDYGGATKVNDPQMYYDAIKAINPNCQVVGNTVGDNPFNWFPYDIGSDEEYYALTTFGPANKTWADVLSSTRVHGITYYVPQELCVNNNGAVGDSFYWHTGFTLRNQSAIQSAYDIAKANSVPFLLNLAPGRTGLISSDQFDLFKNLNL